MQPETKSEVDAAFDEWRENVIRSLRLHAVRASVEGGVQGKASVKGAPVQRGNPTDAQTAENAKYLSDSDFKFINERAVAQAEEYGKLLESEGASIIDGKKVPWLADYDTSQREAVTEAIETGISEGKHPSVIARGLDTQLDISRSHAEMIARTEIGRIQLTAKTDQWEAEGVEKVKVFDDEGPNSCEVCREANGQVWSLEASQDKMLEHPNCVRSFWPYYGDERPVK